MNVQNKLLVSILCIGAVSSVKAADFEEYARVINVAPQIEQVNQPRQECRTEYVPVERQSSHGMGGSIIGGIAGGIIGNQVGGGNGRTAATAVGAIAGAIVGDRVENRDNGTTTTEQQVRECHNVDHWESRTNGYAVTYEYHGHNYTSVVPYDPGERIKLHVSIVPHM